MSKASDLSDKIMDVIDGELKSGACKYADIFGALKATEVYFETDYAIRIHAGIIKATKEPDNAPSE